MKALTKFVSLVRREREKGEADKARPVNVIDAVTMGVSLAGDVPIRCSRSMDLACMIMILSNVELQVVELRHFGWKMAGRSRERAFSGVSTFSSVNLDALCVALIRCMRNESTLLFRSPARGFTNVMASVSLDLRTLLRWPGDVVQLEHAGYYVDQALVRSLVDMARIPNTADLDAWHVKGRAIAIYTLINEISSTNRERLMGLGRPDGDASED